MEEPGRLQSMGSRRIGHDWATSLSLFTFMHWRRKWQPTHCSCLENPRDGGAWWAAIYGVAQSQTGLKRLSSSSSSSLSRKIVDYFIVWPWVSFTSNHSLTWEIKIQIELAAGRSNLPLRSKETNPFLLEIQVMPLLGQMSYRGSPFLWPIVIISCYH